MNYEQAPVAFTGKDLNYLCDMFKWHYGAYKKTKLRIDDVKDEEVKSLMEECSNKFYEHMETILKIIQGGSNE